MTATQWAGIAIASATMSGRTLKEAIAEVVRQAVAEAKKPKPKKGR